MFWSTPWAIVLTTNAFIKSSAVTSIVKFVPAPAATPKDCEGNTILSPTFICCVCTTGVPEASDTDIVMCDKVSSLENDTLAVILWVEELTIKLARGTEHDTDPEIEDKVASFDASRRPLSIVEVAFV